MNYFLNLDKSYWLVLVLLLLLAGSSFAFYTLYSSQKQKAELLTDLHTELKQAKNKLGQTTSTIAVLETERKELLQLSAIKDTQLANLQQILKAHPKAEAATAFSARTSGRAAGKTDTVYLPGAALTDTVRLLTIAGTISQPDIEASIRATPDSVYLDSYTVYTDFEYVETYTKAGLFKPKELVVSIKPTNPNTVVTAGKSWHRPKPKGRLLKSLIFIGAGFVAGVIISS